MPYELKKGSTGKYRFNLKAGNGEIILTSEAYEQRSSALNGIASVQKNGTQDKNFEHRLSSAKQPYFVLKAENGQIIGTSEMYSSESAAKVGVESVKKNAPSTDIREG